MQIVGVVTPDCDWKDKNSERGCRERAVFVVWIRDVQTGKMQGAEIYGCRTHAPIMQKGLSNMAREMTRIDKQLRRVNVADIVLLRNMQVQGRMKLAPDMLAEKPQANLKVLH